VQMLKEKIVNLNKTLKMQIVSTNKIDSIRQKLSDKLKAAKTDNEELSNLNAELKSRIEQLEAKIEELHVQAEQLKVPRSPGEGERLLFEKTKGTYNDKDHSDTGKLNYDSRILNITDNDKASFVKRQTQKIKELEKSNHQLECEIRKV